MKKHPALTHPIPGDVLLIPALSRNHVQVIDVTPWRVTLVHFPNVDRPIAAKWWLWWYRYRCRVATFICQLPLWQRTALVTDDGA